MKRKKPFAGFPDFTRRSAGKEAASPSQAPRVLVVDSDPAVRSQVAELGRDKLLSVVLASTPAQALALARAGAGTPVLDAALLDGAPGAGATALARELREVPGLSRLPIAFLSGDRDVGHRVAAAHAGAFLVLTKPVDPYTLGSALEQMLAAAREPRMRVLVIDDDADFAATIAAVLEPDGIFVGVAPDAARLFETLDDARPDLILLDAMLPSVDGWDVLRAVRTMPEWRDVPVLFLTGRTDVESRVAAFEAGADDFLSKPLVAEELLARVRARLERRRMHRELTERDALTRCLSRRALLESLARGLSESRRHERMLSAAMIDVDRFKRVNDTYGHLVGDQVLVTLGRLLNERFRLEDIRGRWGGEEFVVVFPNAAPATAAAVLSRVLDEFRRIPFRGEAGERFFVTFSAGISSFPSDGTCVHELLRAADGRLYKAKRRGRNQVVCAAVEA